MYLAIDIGGTKTFVASVDNTGTIIERLRFPTPKKYEDFKIELAKNIDNLTTKNFTACGIGAPGKIDRSKGLGVIMGNLPWQSAPIVDDVHAITKLPVVLDNDANLAGLSEASLIPDTFKTILYVTIGTGIGTAIVQDKRLILPDAEGGHMLFAHEGLLQKWESFASGRAIVQKFHKPASEIEDSATWAQIAEAISIGLYNLLASIHPDAVILGGGVSTHFEKFNTRLEYELKSHESLIVPIPPIFKAQKPEEAVLFGCYILAKTAYGQSPD